MFSFRDTADSLIFHTTKQPSSTGLQNLSLHAVACTSKSFLFTTAPPKTKTNKQIFNTNGKHIYLSLNQQSITVASVRFDRIPGSPILSRFGVARDTQCYGVCICDVCLAQSPKQVNLYAVRTGYEPKQWYVQLSDCMWVECVSQFSAQTFYVPHVVCALPSQLLLVVAHHQPVTCWCHKGFSPILALLAALEVCTMTGLGVESQTMWNEHCSKRNLPWKPGCGCSWEEQMLIGWEVDGMPLGKSTGVITAAGRHV